MWLDEHAVGSRNGLGTPHEYDLTEALSPGLHRLTIRVDNRMIVPVGRDAHSVSDQTQSAWNGIVGQARAAGDGRRLARRHPGLPGRRAAAGARGRGNRQPHRKRRSRRRLRVWAESAGPTPQRLPEKRVPAEWTKEGGRLEFEYEMGADARLWDEFSPSLYRLSDRGPRRPAQRRLRPARAGRVRDAVHDQRPAHLPARHARVRRVPAHGVSPDGHRLMEEDPAGGSRPRAQPPQVPLLDTAGGGIRGGRRDGFLLPGRGLGLGAVRQRLAARLVAVRGDRAHHPRLRQPPVVPAAGPGERTRRPEPQPLPRRLDPALDAPRHAPPLHRGLGLADSA